MKRANFAPRCFRPFQCCCRSTSNSKPRETTINSLLLTTIENNAGGAKATYPVRLQNFRQKERKNFSCAVCVRRTGTYQARFPNIWNNIVYSIFVCFLSQSRNPLLRWTPPQVNDAQNSPALSPAREASENLAFEFREADQLNDYLVHAVDHKDSNGIHHLYGHKKRCFID